MQSGATAEELVHSLVLSEKNLERSTSSIKDTLDSLVRNSSRRVEAVIRLETLRLDRDRIIHLETAIQQRNSELLEQSRRELALQEQWSVQMKQLNERARAEGSEGTSDSEEHALMEERANVYRLQISQLQQANSASEIHVRGLLDRARMSHSLSTTRLELARIHALSSSTTVWLAELSLERNLRNAELISLEIKRRYLENKLDEIILDLILRWSETRRGITSSSASKEDHASLSVRFRTLAVIEAKF